MSEAARRVPARLGIAALNLLAPGLGLLRVQRPRAALAFLLAPAALLLLVTLVYALSPDIGFRVWAALMLVLVVAIPLVYLGSIVLSWRAARNILPPGRWYSRWYGIAAALVAVLGIGAVLPDMALDYYRTFYIPSEAMLPTLRVEDRLLGSMRGPGALRRGDVILLDVGGPIYIKRVAALPGDRIAMNGGIVILNGRPVPQRLLGTDRVEASWLGSRARRLAEQFPGETTPHQIYDSGDSIGDDMEEQRVAPGHVFVLGDNRDHSADSRFARVEMGVEQLPIRDIRGRALFYLWGPSGRMGQPLSR